MMKQFVEKSKAPDFYTFLCLPIIGALFIPIAIGLLKPSVIRTLERSVFPFVCILIPAFIFLRANYDRMVNGYSTISCLIRYLRPLPPGLIIGTDLKKRGVPAFTLLLIIINVSVFFLVSEKTFNAGVFPPAGVHTKFEFLISMFTSAFLHGDVFHLGGNMMFLWVFGRSLEPRIGSFRFLLAYFLCSVISDAFAYLLLNMQAEYLKSDAFKFYFRSFGASGAISGIMGLFVVRCFFVKIIVSCPVFINPFISLPLKIQGLFFVSLFFAIDIAGSVQQFKWFFIRNNYWAHVGGYLSGFLIAYLMGLYRAGTIEAMETKASRLAKIQKGNAIKLYKEILVKDPRNGVALKSLFEIYHEYNHEKAYYYFHRLIMTLFEADISKAASVIDITCLNYLNRLPGPVLLKLGLCYYKNADLEKARHCFELSSKHKGPWQAKAMFSLGETYEIMGFLTQAKTHFKAVADGFQNVFHRAALQKLAQLQ
jgi:membrane associated rhomboid family serine protease